MNWPNRLSLMRMASVPVLTGLMLVDAPWARYAALFGFMLSAATDFVDGWMARKYRLITNFGKFIDPVADKILVLSTMIMLSWHHLLPGWLVAAVLLRELAVDGLRMVAVEQGRVIAAGRLGKLKTICQMAMIVVHLAVYANLPPAFFGWLTLPTQIAALVMTVWSGVDYLIHNKEVLHG